MHADELAARVRILLDRYGETFAHEAGIRLEKNTPAPLFQLLYAAMLFSARIAARNASQATRALIHAGLTTPQKMLEATWQQRVDVITWHGYKRYDERTATMLGEAAELLVQRYNGDLRNLRALAQWNVHQEHALLTEFKGIGSVGADIFLREVQLVWDEVYPYADKKVLKAARKLGLGDSAAALSRWVSRADFARLTAALVRVDLAGAYASLV